MKVDALALPFVGERFRIERDGVSLGVIRLSDGSRVGTMELEPRSDGLFVKSLCIDPEHRGYGAGSEAATLLNRLCDEADVSVVTAWAAPNLGLSVYFWIRMGFRPLHGEGPEGGIWFERRRNLGA